MAAEKDQFRLEDNLEGILPQQIMEDDPPGGLGAESQKSQSVGAGGMDFSDKENVNPKQMAPDLQGKGQLGVQSG